MTLRARDTLGFLEQTVWGTPIIADMKPIPVTAAPTWTYNSGDFMSSQHHVSGQANIMKKGNYTYSCEVPCEFDAGDMLPFFKAFFGDVTTSADTPVAGAHQHVFIPTITSADFAQMYTKGFTFGGLGVDDAKGSHQKNCVVTKIEIPETENGVYPCNISYMSSDKVNAPITSVTGTTNDTATLFNTLQAVVSVGVDASEVAQPITVTGIAFEKEGVAGSFRAASNEAARWVHNEGSFITAKGTFEIEVSDTEYTAVLDDFVNSDEMSVLLTYTTDDFITGTTPYSFLFDMPECKYTAQEGRTDGSLRYIKITFEAGRDSGANMITATAISNKATV